MMFLCLPVFLNVIHVWYMPWNSCPKSRRTWICHCPFLSVFVGCTMKFWRHLGDRIPLLCWSRCRLWLNGLVHRIRGREWRKPDGDQPWLLIDVGMMVLESHRIHGAGIYANMWGILMVNVTIYTIHGSYGNGGGTKEYHNIVNRYQQHIDANIVLYYTGSIDKKTVYIGGSHTKPILGYTLWFS